MAVLVQLMIEVPESERRDAFEVLGEYIVADNKAALDCMQWMCSPVRVLSTIIVKDLGLEMNGQRRGFKTKFIIHTSEFAAYMSHNADLVIIDSII